MFKVYMNYEDYAERLSIYIFDEAPEGEARALCTGLNPVEWKHIHKDAAVEEPTILLTGMMSKPFLQAIVDGCKKIGITAEGEPVIANELVATKYHLEDMRRLALVDLA